MSDGKVDGGRYGLLGKMRAQPGKREELVRLLQESSRDVPGKLVYLISLEQDDPDCFWITEVWEDKGAYLDCLELPQVMHGVELAAPLIAGIEQRVETIPVEGQV